MGVVRRPAVAGTFYPAEPSTLGRLVDNLLAATEGSATEGSAAPAGAHAPVGLLVPHAGLVYSGAVAATAWRLIAESAATVVLLGTNHSYAGLDGVAAWPGGAWATPFGEVAIDGDLSERVLALGRPFIASREAHAREHSLEVQLPLLARVAPRARVVPLAVGLGTGASAVAAGRALGSLVAERRAAGERIVLAISTDMAHYPPARLCGRITTELVPHLLALDPEGLARAEAAASTSGPAVVCGMCGIEPSVLGLAALRAMGAAAGTLLAAATSADAGADPSHTVGYCSIAWPAGPASA